MNSCSGLVGTDTLGAFDWTCDTLSGAVIFYSRIKESKGLADLLTASAWLENRFQVTHSTGGIVGESSLATWWGNSISEAPYSTAGLISLNVSGQIYVVSSDQTTRGYTFDADKIALVVRNGQKLTASSIGATATIFLSSPTSNPARRFLWIEGNFSGVVGGTTNNLIKFVDTSFSVIRRASATNCNAGTIQVDSGSAAKGSNFLSQIRTSGGTYGVHIHSSYNTLSEVNVSNTTNVSGNSAGIHFWGYPGNVLVGGVTTGVNGDLGGMDMCNGSTNGFMARLTAANGYKGFESDYTATSNTYHNIAAYNNTIGLRLGNAISNFTASEVAVANSSTAEVQINGTGTVSPNKFTGTLLKGVGACTVTAAGASVGLTNATCDNQGANSNATITPNINLSSTFEGAVTADSSNTSHVFGQATYAADLDWFRFDSFLRAFGKDVKMECTAGVCQIYDWVLKIGSVLHNINGIFSADTDCPASVSGNKTLSSMTGVTYLKTAVELVGDDIGNDNGLCESGETCLYTPNIGAYQGHGSLGTCTFSGGTVTEVTMYGYSINGY